MKKYTLYLIIVGLLYSCDNKPIENSIDLENLSLDFDVDNYYKDEFGINLEEEKKLNKFQRMFSKFNHDHWVDIDTIAFKNVKNLGSFDAVKYTENAYSESDKAGYFGKNYFSKIDMMRTSKGEFMAALALKKSNEEQTLFLADLEKKYGSPKTANGEFMNDFTIHYWELEDRMIAYTSVTEKHNESASTKRRNIKISTTFVSRILILNNKYKDDAILSRLNSGDWLYFMDIFEENRKKVYLFE